MTNYEKIKNMSIKDMAKFMYDVEESPCNHCSDGECDGNCEHRFKEWLMQENMEWISVKDRLPAYDTPVLVYRPTMASKILVDEYQGFWDEDDLDKWCEGWALYGKYNGKDIITHWMPLPEPPKG